MFKRESEIPFTVRENEIVVVKEPGKKKIFARAGVFPLVDGEAVVGFHPVIEDEKSQVSLIGKLQPDGSVILPPSSTKGSREELTEIRKPTTVERGAYALGSKLLGW